MHDSQRITDMSSNKKVDASVAPQSENSKCGNCKNNVVKSCVKCSVCFKSFHPSCGVKFGKCCGEIITLSSLDMKDVQNTDKTSSITDDSTMKDLMLKIIEELEARNLLLMENTSLLKIRISDMENKLNEKDDQIAVLNKKLKIHAQMPINIDKDVAVPTVVIPDASASTSDRESVSNNDHSSTQRSAVTEIRTTRSTTKQHKNKVTLKNVNKAIQEAKDKQLMQKYIDVEKDVPCEKSEEDNSEWKVQSRKRSRRQRTLVVGNYDGPSTVEGIEKYKAFHVSNLKPTTTVEELQAFLGTNFTDVRCELVKSRYPECYASFKVLIKENEYEKVFVSANWPNRASVHRFFQPRASFLTRTQTIA